MATNLLSLPVEVLILLRKHLHTMSDHATLSLLCRTTQSLYNEEHWHAIASRAGISKPTFYGDLNWRGLLYCIAHHSGICEVCAAHTPQQLEDESTQKKAGSAPLTPNSLHQALRRPGNQDSDLSRIGLSLLLYNVGRKGDRTIDRPRVHGCFPDDASKEFDGDPLRKHPGVASILAISADATKVTCGWSELVTDCVVFCGDTLTPKELRAHMKRRGGSSKNLMDTMEAGLYYRDDLDEFFHTSDSWFAPPAVNKDGLTLLDVMTTAADLPGYPWDPHSGESLMLMGMRLRIYQHGLEIVCDCAR